MLLGLQREKRTPGCGSCISDDFCCTAFVGALATLACLTAALAQEVRRVTDSASPPASILLYTLAPEKIMIGWVRTPSPADKAFLAQRRIDIGGTIVTSSTTNADGTRSLTATAWSVPGIRSALTT
jgi:hypothetical protein